MTEKLRIYKKLSRNRGNGHRRYFVKFLGNTSNDAAFALKLQAYEQTAILSNTFEREPLK